MKYASFDQKLDHVPAGWNDRLHFFKYMSCSTAKIVLKNRTIRYSSPKFLNDPFDIQFYMDIKNKKEDIKDASLDSLWRVYSGDSLPNHNNIVGFIFSRMKGCFPRITREKFIEEFSSAFDDGFEAMLSVLPSINDKSSRIIENNKMLCLTSRPDNVLMWSHYADGHKGVVLRFRSIPALDTPYGLAKPINYVSDIPSLLDLDQLVGIFSGTASILEAGILDRILYTKSDIWSYEQEWRLSAGLGREPSAYFEDNPFGRNDVDGIIFGLRTSDDDKRELTDLASTYPNVEFMKSARSMSDFRVWIEPLNST